MLRPLLMCQVFVLVEYWLPCKVTVKHFYHSLLAGSLICGCLVSIVKAHHTFQCLWLYSTCGFVGFALLITIITIT